MIHRSLCCCQECRYLVLFVKRIGWIAKVITSHPEGKVNRALVELSIKSFANETVVKKVRTKFNESQKCQCLHCTCCGRQLPRISLVFGLICHLFFFSTAALMASDRIHINIGEGGVRIKIHSWEWNLRRSPTTTDHPARPPGPNTIY